MRRRTSPASQWLAADGAQGDAACLHVREVGVHVHAHVAHAEGLQAGQHVVVVLGALQCST